MTEITVVGIGELLWDMLPTGKVAGGAPANFAYFAGREGADAKVVSAVGDDALGAEIIARMDGKKIGHLVTVDRGHPTGTVDVTVNQGIPSYVINENVAWDHLVLSKEAEEAVKKADIIGFGTLACRNDVTKSAVIAALRLSKKDAVRFFDVNLRGDYYSRELIEELLETATVLKLNDEELVVFRRMFPCAGDDAAFIKGMMAKHALDYVILTAGGDYSRVYAENDESYIKTPLVAVVDTVGAGDAFSGAFAVALRKGMSFKDAHARAVKAAAEACAKAGAWG